MRALLVLVIALAAVLRLWRLDEVGFGNLYYAATVRSMLTGPANLLYASFDPAGFVSVDKPPLGFWVQAAFAAVLGYGGLALQLPQALAGIASVAVLYALVARTFGAPAGVIAALVLAITPVAVAVDRNNTIDAQLTLVLLGATYALVRACERGDLRWLIVSAALVGVGFNVKMAQAYLPVPAFVLAYAGAARIRARARAVHLVAFAAVTAAVSVLWIAVVDLTPPSARPYVGSSTDNTALQLAVGHNGAARLGALSFGLFQPGPRSARPAAPGPPVTQPPPPGPAGGPQDEVGAPGPLRLFNAQLAGQVSWGLPFAFVVPALIWPRERRTWPLASAPRDVVLWWTWLVGAAVFISFGGIIHRYYLVMLAPPAAALIGIGAVAALGSRALARAIAIAGVAGSAVASAAAIGQAPSPWTQLPMAIGLGAGLVVSGIVVAPRLWAEGRALAVTGALLLALSPALWATTPLDGGAPGLPYASPQLLARGPGLAAAPRPGTGVGPHGALADFLAASYRGERFAAATATANTAAPIIVATGLPVMAFGGFSGGDPILGPGRLEAAFREGQVRFLIVDDRTRADVRDIARRRCSSVPPSVWRGPQAGPGMPVELFDCAGLR